MTIEYTQQPLVCLPPPTSGWSRLTDAHDFLLTRAIRDSWATEAFPAAMAAWLQLEGYKADLNATIEVLSNHRQNPEGLVEDEAENTPQPLVLPEASVKVHRARRTIKASITELQILLEEPPDCVQELSGLVSLSFYDLTDGCRTPSSSLSSSAEPAACMH